MIKFIFRSILFFSNKHKVLQPVRVVALCLLVCLGSKASAIGTHTDTAQNVNIKVSANSKSGVYKTNEAVSFKLNLNSTYKQAQDGSITCLIYTDFGTKVYENTITGHIGGDGTASYDMTLPAQKTGVYQVAFRFNFTSYDDTIKRIFVVNPSDIKPGTKKPADFGAFWKSNLTQLKTVAPEYKITEQKDKSTKDVKVYLVEMHSYDNAVIRGWLSIPVKKPHRIPVIYRLPGYVVELKPDLNNKEFAVFNLNTRGSGNSKSAVKIDGEFNYYHLMNRDEYIYKGVYLDCVRGLDFIFANATQYGFDLNRVAADGGSQGGCLALVLAGLDHRVNLVTSELPLYSDLRDVINIGPVLYPEKKSPVWMLDYYSKRIKISRETVLNVWDYYDPVNFADSIKCPVLLAISLLDELVPPRGSFSLFNQLASKKKEYWVNPLLTHEVDEKYYQFQYYWVKETLRLP